MKQEKNYSDAKIVSFAQINKIIEEDRLDDAFISEENILNPGKKAKDLLPENVQEYIERFNLSHVLNTAIRHLSTGELAKILIVQAISDNPKALILEEPFDGLDVKSREELTKVIENLIESGVDVKVFSSRDNNKITGTVRRVPKIPAKIGENNTINISVLAELKNIHIQYGDKIVLDNVNWTIKKNEHWKITGPNGCGKSTLLSLISGDNPQSFVNDITLFGKKRGTGESIWDIKKNIGIVSTLFHRDYRVNISAINVIISGFHDTTGIYRKPSLLEIDTANQWLNLAWLGKLAKKPFASLSYGEQRLILIIRAMVKHPKILILDEPCFGLDNFNRELVLNLIEILAQSPDTTILFVSHHEEDFTPSIKNHLEFVKSEEKSGFCLKFT